MNSKKIVNTANFVKLLTKYKEYNVVGHIRPDGDCVGSQLAIANILEQLGIKCNVIKNSNVGRVLSRFFDGYELINDNEMDISLPLICVDCSDFRRTYHRIGSGDQTGDHIVWGRQSRGRAGNLASQSGFGGDQVDRACRDSTPCK